MKWSTRTSHALIGLTSLVAVAAAVAAQYQWDMQPCPWCILQRLIFVAVAAVALLSAAQPLAWVHRLTSLVIIALSASGVAAAWWQHFVAAKTSSCALTLADRILSATGLDTAWPDVFEVRASCADAVAHLIGVPFEFWSLALFALLGLVAIPGLMARSRRHA
jgi:protein dithiol:quinone oxidoreductase